MTVHGAVGEPYDVTGFPTIKIFGADKKAPVDYAGDRTASKMAAAALKVHTYKGSKQRQQQQRKQQQR
jgi:hypothetical protein